MPQTRRKQPLEELAKQVLKDGRDYREILIGMITPLTFALRARPQRTALVFRQIHLTYERNHAILGL